MLDTVTKPAPKTSAPSAPSLESAIADFVHGLTPAALTEPVRRAARRLIEDQIANQIACAQLPWSRQALQFTLSQKLPGVSRIAASGESAAAVDAAFINATYGHGFEYDDAHRQSASHPGACVVPAALALGEEVGATQDEVLTALVAGYEVYTRIGSLAAPDLLLRGFHPHCLLSTFGAAAVAAKLRKLSHEQTWHALAIAASHASGITEYTSSGGSVKRVHSGIGARNGMRAALMAEHGVTGPETYLTGNKGLYRTFVQKVVAPSAAAEWFGPNAPFQIEKVWIKPYLCCGCIHAYIDAISRFSGQIAQIDWIDVQIQPSANTPVGTKNAHAYTPSTIEQVQFSLPVQLAFTLLGLGNGYQVHLRAMEGQLDLSPDGAILTTSRLIRMTEDPALDERYAGKFVADLTVHYKDGRSEHVFVEDSTGTIENPINQAQLDAKFRELTVDVLSEAPAESLLAATKAFGGDQPAASYTALFAV